MSMTQKRLSASFSDNPSPFIAARSPSATPMPARSEEHTSELQSRLHLVCRLLLEKKKKTIITTLLLLAAPTSLQHTIRPYFMIFQPHSYMSFAILLTSYRALPSFSQTSASHVPRS